MRLSGLVTGWLLAVGLALGTLAPPADAQTSPDPLPIEAYGQVPAIRMVELAPDGKSFAVIMFDGEHEALLVFDTSMKGLLSFNTDTLKVRDVKYASPDVIMLSASDTLSRSVTGTHTVEYDAAVAIVISTGHVHQLLTHARDVSPYQSSIGKIVGYSDNKTYVYVPAYTNKQNAPRLSLFRVRLADGVTRKVESGREGTIDYFVDDEGEIVVREEYDDNGRVYTVRARQPNGKMKDIYELKDVDIPQSSVAGLTPDGKGIVYYRSADEGRADYVIMDMETGEIGETVFDTPTDIDRIIRDGNRHVLGAAYSGMTPTYWFFDEQLTEDVKKVQAAFPGQSVSLDSMSDDHNLMLILVEGPDFSGDYFLFDRRTMQASYLTAMRPDIFPGNVVPMEVYTYEARDGLEIEAVLTGRPGEGEAPKPLILLPHGGPAAHDVIGFDWMAQYFASRGYVVLQPNFRGSSGYGLDFADMSKGEWGGAMQDDLTDGVAAVVADGIADPDRICIVGASYGGYAALMGGATTPDLYKCVVAIAPVTDPKRLITDAMDMYGRDSVSERALLSEFGLDDHSESLEDATPLKFADAFAAPVLIVHGEDDSVVPFRQSEAMRDALRKAGKYVRFESLKGGDHWLTQSDTRLQALKAVDAFLKEYLPVD